MVQLSAHKLPAERVLAQRLNVSRTTVREAIRVLATEGYVESQRGAAGGLVVVARHKPRTQLKQRLKDEWIRFEEILEFWLANERAAASLAATRRTEENLGRLADTLEAIRLSESLPQFRRTDSALHLAIAGAARNSVLHRAAEDGRTAMFLPMDALDIRVLLGSALEGHRRILATIEASDPQGAEEAMAAHTETARRALRAKLVIREEK